MTMKGTFDNEIRQAITGAKQKTKANGTVFKKRKPGVAEEMAEGELSAGGGNEGMQPQAPKARASNLNPKMKFAPKIGGRNVQTRIR